MSEGSQGIFREAGRRAAARVAAIHFARALRATVVPVFLVAIVAVLGLRWYGVSGFEVVGAVGLVVVWLVGCKLYAVVKRPGEFPALALWDEAAGRREAFASAQFFEASDGGGERVGEALHVERTEAALREAGVTLKADLPLPGTWWVPVFPVVLVAVVFSGVMVPEPLPGEAPMDEGMLVTAEEEAAKLTKEQAAFEKMEGMTEEEKERAEKLKEALAGTAEELESAEGKSAEEVLSELEARAREAEKLAKELGEANEDWVSDAMLAEMRQHVDTADLAESLEDEDAAQSAEEAEKISEKLADDALTAEVRDRVGEALERTTKAATEEDEERAVGKHFGKASEEMQKLNTPAAATEFAELAKHFEKLEQRQKAQEELEKLAEKLRESGANIAGQNGSGMEKLAGNEGGQMGDVPEMELPDGMSPQDGGAELADGQLPVPGLNSPMAPGSMQDLPMMKGGQAPVPGTAPPGDGQPMALVPGEMPEDGQPMMMLSAPIPGTKPAAAFAVPGTGGQGNSPMAGGLQAGRGTAGLGNAGASDLTGATQLGTVGAAINSDGESTFRAVEGGTRDELATRGRREFAIDFIKVQEEALDEQPLPLSRRNDVKRYFSTIRKRFEGE